MDLGLRRSLVRESGMLAGGPAGSDKSELSPTLSLVARVTHGNMQRCLDLLLPGDSDEQAAQRRTLADRLGKLEDGTEMFTQYRLSETARVQANGLLDKADRELTKAATQPPGPAQQALRQQAMAFVKQADAVTRDPANYAPEGFGWTLLTGTAIEKSRGPRTRFAQREGEQTEFVQFNGVSVSPSRLLAAMA
jgi:hypothetical protein